MTYVLWSIQMMDTKVFLKHYTQMVAILCKKLCAIQYKVNIQCILRFNLYILPNMEIGEWYKILLILYL